MPRREYVCERRSGLPRPLLVPRRHFGGDDDATGADLRFQHFADEAFAVSVTVRQCGVEERDAALDGFAQRIPSLAIVAAEPLGAAQSPAAQPQLADGESRGAEAPRMQAHGSILGSLAGHSHAAPRTPLESPCAAGTTRVATGSDLAP